MVKNHFLWNLPEIGITIFDGIAFGSEIGQCIQTWPILERKKKMDSANINYLDIYKIHSVPGTGLEPVRPLWPRDFKSLVSTNSTIWAALRTQSYKEKLKFEN